MTRFSGKSVIVTGCSNGIGRATAVLFSRYGAQVTITGRDSERLEVTKEKMLKAGALPQNINLVVANLTDPNGQDHIIQSTLKALGKIDVLVNNAGANIVDGTSNTDQSIDLYHKTFQINFQSVVEMIKKTKEYLIKTKGEIVNVSSIAAGPQALPMAPYYAASKAALDQYTRCVAIDLIQYGVRVNSVSPGAVSTGFLTAMGLPEQAQQKAESFIASHKECVPAGVLGKPEDIAELIVFLSDRKRSSYIIGQSIVADGGSTLVAGMHAHDLHDMLGL
uniref:3-oxoacyl-[acyl-carrier-protein] reductase n=1 Tax=Caenorhabditis tropicalis TaxID=1561998 RepID=A0A1I7TSX6_9PELO